MSYGIKLPPAERWHRPKDEEPTLREKLRCSIITKLCTDAYSPDIPLINRCIVESGCKLPLPKK